MTSWRVEGEDYGQYSGNLEFRIRQAVAEVGANSAKLMFEMLKSNDKRIVNFAEERLSEYNSDQVIEALRSLHKTDANMRVETLYDYVVRRKGNIGRSNSTAIAFGKLGNEAAEFLVEKLKKESDEGKIAVMLLGWFEADVVSRIAEKAWGGNIELKVRNLLHGYCVSGVSTPARESFKSVLVSMGQSACDLIVGEWLKDKTGKVIWILADFPVETLIASVDSVLKDRKRRSFDLLFEIIVYKSPWENRPVLAGKLQSFGEEACRYVFDRLEEDVQRPDWAFKLLDGFPKEMVIAGWEKLASSKKERQRAMAKEKLDKLR